MKGKNAINLQWGAGVLLLALCCAGPANRAQAVGLQVASGTSLVGGPFATPVVVLTWLDAASSGFPNVTTYNLYRKVDPARDWPKMPLNAKPLALETDLAKLTTLLGPDLRNAVSQALGTSVNPQDPSAPPLTLRLDLALRNVVHGSAQWTNLQVLAGGKWQVAVAIGQGYKDTDVTAGVRYYYKLSGLDAGGNPQVSTNIEVTAGVAAPIPPPQNVKAEAGDSRVLVTWDDPLPGTLWPAGYYVERSEAGGQFYRINESGLATRVRALLYHDPTNPPPLVNGLLDMQRWDETGWPMSSSTVSAVINGPQNRVAYSYRVTAMDLLGTASSLSSQATLPVTPRDRTRPQTPTISSVVLIDARTIQIKWPGVVYDTDGHVELQYDPLHPAAQPQLGLTRYRIFRCLDANDPSNNVVQVKEIVLPPSQYVPTLTCLDDVGQLRPPYGATSYWYRVECEDAATNVSTRSGAVVGHLRDITPPASPLYLDAKGYENYIRVTWNPAPEPDLGGYLIFRSSCHAGTNGWIQVGYLSRADAELAAATNADQPGFPLFDDKTLPTNSPLCYGYIVKVEDQSQNKSGPWPPDSEKELSFCRRLHKTTPPPPAVITKLEAGDSSVKVSWVAAPQQDIRAYYVYRSLTETETNGYTFVGGLTVEKDLSTGNPLPGLLLTEPLGTNEFRLDFCDDHALIPFRQLGEGTYTDTSVLPKVIYWYKVLGVDQSGNISDVNDTNAAPVSTFTFTTIGPALPTNVSATPSASPCQVSVAWSPTFDPSLHSGFVVLRSSAVGGPFLPIGSLVANANQYTDSAVQHGSSYWYEVVAIDRRGVPSDASSPAPAKMP